MPKKDGDKMASQPSGGGTGGGSVIPFPDWQAQLKRAEGGALKKCLSNVMIYVRNLPGLGKQIRFNELTAKVEWKGEPLTDEDLVDIRLMIEAQGYVPPENDVRAAVNRLAKDNAYNPIADYLTALRWDNQPRIDMWLIDLFGAPDHELIRAFGSKFLIAAVARALRPGCKVDTMLVLEGAQGIKKTTAVATLFGKKYMRSGMKSFHGDDAAIAIQGRWVVEVGELAALSRTDDREAKDFLSEEVDSFRPKYGRNVIDRPRRCVFVGTTNEKEYLKDPTGGRRYWPVPCESIDIEALAAIKDQLWAEAVHRFNAGEKWWLEGELETEAKKVQADRFDEDVWASAIDKWLGTRTFVTVPEVLSEALKITVDKHDKRAQMRVAGHLQRIGWKRDLRRFDGGKPIRGWAKPDRLV